MTIILEPIKQYLLDMQQRLCRALEQEDGVASFREDAWQHQSGGGGLTRVIADGKVIEKGGVNFSHVQGAELPKAATAKRPELANARFQAMGVSTVLHPLNPYVPTSHMNVRCIVVEKPNHDPMWWFGGGFDLTPYYGFTDDCEYWHQTAKAACDPFGADVYPRFKKWADDYFYLAHRGEARGIGGIFYDDLNEWSFERCFDFMRSVGDHFITAYIPIVTKRKHHAFGERERAFQLHRRGRYVEFNLLYDRGTMFGLQSGGRTESILMSLPPQVAWGYNHQPEAETPEASLYRDFLPPKTWVAV